jgi:hypothetical protein
MSLSGDLDLYQQTTARVLYTFSFKKSQLFITYSRSIFTKAGRLTITEYTEFTDGSGRSNYALREVFVRA